LTVKTDLEHAIARAEASKGEYLLFGADSEDQTAQKVFRDMAEDMERHVKILESRLQYLGQHNKLNADGASQLNQSGKGQSKQDRWGQDTQSN